MMPDDEKSGIGSGIVNPIKGKTVFLTKDECACILVGLNEFDDIIYAAKSGCFDAYKELNTKLIEQFRQISLEIHN